MLAKIYISHFLTTTLKSIPNLTQPKGYVCDYNLSESYQLYEKLRIKNS